MHSRKLQQIMDLVLDTMGMRGSVSRREVAERVYSMTVTDGWAPADERDARMSWLMGEAAAQMNQPLSEEFIAQHMPKVPARYQAIINRLPRFICITPKGGRDSRHVMSLVATDEEWAASVMLKTRIVAATERSRDADREIYDLLIKSGAKSLQELCGREMAA